jgi:macrolide-specific efflux system membrane fusion protein
MTITVAEPVNKAKRQLRKKLLLWSLLILLTAVASYAAWRNYEKPKPVEFLTTTVQKGDVEQIVLATGTLEAAKKLDVGAQASGQIKKLYVELGSSVQIGQTLADIDSELTQSDLNANEALLLNQEAQIEVKKVFIKKARAEVDRQRVMLLANATSSKLMENSLTDLEQLEGEEKALQASAQQTRSQIQKNKTTLRYTKITAPMTGTVVDIVTKEGQTVNSAQTSPVIVRLADLRNMQVKAQISEADIDKVHAGQQVRFKVLGQRGREYRSEIESIEPTPQRINNAIYFNALFKVANPEQRLRIDTTAEVRLSLAESKGVLYIPVSAISKDNLVRVINKAGTVEQRSVRVGLKSATRAEILSGLVEGEKVVTASSSDYSEAELKALEQAPEGPPPVR